MNKTQLILGLPIQKQNLIFSYLLNDFPGLIIQYDQPDHMGFIKIKSINYLLIYYYTYR